MYMYMYMYMDADDGSPGSTATDAARLYGSRASGYNRVTVVQRVLGDNVAQETVTIRIAVRLMHNDFILMKRRDSSQPGYLITLFTIHILLRTFAFPKWAASPEGVSPLWHSHPPSRP